MKVVKRVVVVVVDDVVDVVVVAEEMGLRFGALGFKFGAECKFQRTLCDDSWEAREGMCPK